MQPEDLTILYTFLLYLTICERGTYNWFNITVMIVYLTRSYHTSLYTVHLSVIYIYVILFILNICFIYSINVYNYQLLWNKHEWTKGKFSLSLYIYIYKDISIFNNDCYMIFKPDFCFKYKKKWYICI